jgi:acyl dehydratase
MITVETPQELMAYVGQPLGTSNWLAVDQSMIDRFAAVTGDDNWIHIDAARAAREMPGGKTIAHGFLTLSLTPVMAREIFNVKNVGRAINYGADNLRFTGMVAVGTRVRMTMHLKEAKERPDGSVRYVLTSAVFAEGQDKPVCIFDKLLLLYPTAS